MLFLQYSNILEDFSHGIGMLWTASIDNVGKSMPRRKKTKYIWFYTAMKMTCIYPPSVYFSKT